MAKKMEIFKPGTHTALNGQALDFTEADLAATVAAYDPKKFQAPLVIGHPAVDAPAYGWVDALSYAEGSMQAEPVQVDAAFAELVNAGRFKKVSASFYQPDAPGNPVPGVYYLRHVGFLGAHAPAVKGLRPVSFAASEEGVLEFGSWEERVNAGMWRRLRDFLISKFGLEEADQAIPGFDVDLLAEEAARPAPLTENAAAAVPQYAECPEGQHHKREDRDMPTPEELAAREADLQQKEASFAEREKKLRDGERQDRHREHVSFAEGLVKEGKLLPAMQGTAVALLDFAAGLEDGQQVVEFGEGAAKKSLPAAVLFKDFLTGQPKVIEFGEVAGGEVVGGAIVDFAAAPGCVVEAEGLELHRKAVAYQDNHPGVEYLAAVRAVS